VPGLDMRWIYLVLFVLGLGAGGQTVSFAVVKDNNPNHLVGTASGFNNLAVLLGGAIFQPLIGIILSSGNGHNFVDGIPFYTVNSYKNALFVMPCCYLFSLIIVFFVMKESHPGSLSSPIIDDFDEIKNTSTSTYQ
jgi:MFS family permease